jgi:hypothetical protein
VIWRFIKRILSRRKIYQPFQALPQAMAEKDPELYEAIRKMDIPSGIREWRKVHPEDFTDCQ